MLRPTVNEQRGVSTWCIWTGNTGAIINEPTHGMCVLIPSLFLKSRPNWYMPEGIRSGVDLRTDTACVKLIKLPKLKPALSFFGNILLYPGIAVPREVENMGKRHDSFVSACRIVIKGAVSGCISGCASRPSTWRYLAVCCMVPPASVDPSGGMSTCHHHKYATPPPIQSNAHTKSLLSS